MTDGQTGTGAGAPRRRPLRRLALAALSIALLLGGLELALRVTGDRERAASEGLARLGPRGAAWMQARLLEAVPDPVRRYALRPSSSATVGGILFRASSHRTRGPEFPAEKAPGEKRLLMLGDSFCYGQWAAEGETLVGHLTRMANEAEAANGSGITWRAVNLGVPGYHSGQQLRALEQDGFALDPDVVVLYYNTNDIVDDGFFWDEELGALRSDHLPLPVWLRRALWNSHLYGFLARRMVRRWMSRPDPYFDPSVPFSHVRPENMRATAGAIERIAELCRERDVPLFMVDQPLMNWSGPARSSDWKVLPLVRWAEDVRERCGIAGISLLGWMRGFSDGRDRLAEWSGEGEPPPMDFLPERSFADPVTQRFFTILEAGGDPSADPEVAHNLEYMRLVAAGEDPEEHGVAVPTDTDFHLTGEGYGHLARICYPALREAGMLP